ncbi:MAG: MFS transporter [Chloroflexota bacterium]
MKRLSALGHGPNHKWWVLAAVQIGVLMSTIDSGIVSVSLPTIMRQFHADVAMIQWTVLAYLLTITVTLLPFGRLADMYGRKQIYVLGFVIFTAGSALCGASGSAEQLSLFRALQALGASMLMANGMAITTAVFPARERGRALGIQGTVVATGTTIGPTIGGLLTQWLGWRSIFYVNIPIGVIGIIAVALAVNSSEIVLTRPGHRPSFDLAGALTAAVGLLALLLGLSGIGQLGLPGETAWVLYGVAAAALVTFITIERRVAEPMIDLGLFQRRLFALGSVAALLSFLAFSANSFLLPFYLQLILGFPPSQAGLLMTPTSLAIAVVAPVSGWLSDRLGARLLSTLGMSIVCLALFSLSRLDASSGYTDVVLRLVLLGFGQGIFQSPNSSSVMGAVPRERYGVASGFISMMRNLGMVVGTGLASSVLMSGLIATVGHVDLAALGEVGGQADTLLINGFMTGLERAYFVAALIAALGILASLSRGGSFGRKAAEVAPAASHRVLPPGTP